MYKSSKNINKNNKGKKSKINEIKENKIFNDKRKVIPAKSKFPYDTEITNTNNIIKNDDNDEHVIAKILKTNNLKNELYQNQKIYQINSKIVNNDYEEIGNFNFINISEEVKPFLYKPQKAKEYSSHAFNNFHFLDIVNSYKMIINILIDDDSLHSSNDLLKIFETIILSLYSLYEINISNKDFLVCIFFQHFSSEKTFKQIFPGLNFFNCDNWNLKMNTFYCSYGDVVSFNDTHINVLSFYKEGATFVEVYKFFYCNILNDLLTLINMDLKEIGKTFLVVNWPNGKNFEKSINKYNRSRLLSNIFRISNNRNMILIPDINYYPYHKKDYFGYINKYDFDSDKIYINLLWDMMCGYPIDHRFFFINMNFKLYSILQEYYLTNKINIYANPYYHDYNLSIYIRNQIKNIVIQKILQVKIEYHDLPFTLNDYFYDFTLKRGSEYANFFSLIFYFFSFSNMSCIKFLQKFVVLFKLICFFVEYFWLGLSLLISYAVFNDTFGSKNNNMDYFCSLGYAMIVILLLLISTIYIKNKPKIKKNKIYRNVKRNNDSEEMFKILYAIHYFYNIFFLVCSIIALIHLEQGKSKEKGDYDYYIFQKKNFISLLSLNSLFIFLPSFIRINNFFSKGFLYYLIFQIPNSTCFFYIPYLFTSIRNITSERSFESFYITLYLLFNGLLTVMCLVFDTKRQRRMDFLFVIATIFAVLNGIKLIILVIGYCFENKFNKKIWTGEIPQYNIVLTGKDNNIKYDDINDNNYDNFKNNKNESKLSINNNIYEKQYSYQNDNNENNLYLNNQSGLNRQYSSQFDITPKNKLNIDQSLDKKIFLSDEKNQKKKNLKKNVSYTNFYDNKFTNISIKKILKKDIDNKSEKEKHSYDINNINNFNNDNIDNNYNNDYNDYNDYNYNNINNDNKHYNYNNCKFDNYNINNNIEGMNYPFDSTIDNQNININNEKNINDNYNFNINEEIVNVPIDTQKISIEQNMEFNLGKSSISKIENVEDYYDENL